MTLVDDNTGSGKGLSGRPALLGLAAALALIGLAGYSHAAVGYALFLIATLLVGLGSGLLGVFALSRAFDGEALRRAYAGAFWAGAWSYVLAVAALSGYYVHEAFAGRVELRFILFGPAILAAIAVLDVGIWRVIVQRNLPTIGRFGDLWRRDSLDQEALRRTLLNEVLLHKTLFSVSPYRWARHQLILWGFGLMFLIELVAVAFREAFPAFGWIDLWDQPLHPLKLAFDLAYDLTGLAVLAGCLMALWFRIRVNGTEQQKFTDTPTAAFLAVVVLTGFLTEGARLAQMPDAPGNWASFVGAAFAPIAPASETGHEVLWIVHALMACAFIAYVPLKRLIHSCATPLGRLANSQTGLLSAKKKRSLSGLMRRSG